MGRLPGMAAGKGELMLPTLSRRERIKTCAAHLVAKYAHISIDMGDHVVIGAHPHHITEALEAHPWGVIAAQSHRLNLLGRAAGRRPRAPCAAQYLGIDGSGAAGVANPSSKSRSPRMPDLSAEGWRGLLERLGAEGSCHEVR